MSNVVPFRLARDGSDKDIEKVLNNTKNRTKRIKELLRLGIEYEAIKQLENTQPNIFFTKQDAAPRQFQCEDIQFNNMNVAHAEVVELSDEELKNNLLAGFE